MDMYPSFKSGDEEYFPKAMIVFDRLHVIKVMHERAFMGRSSLPYRYISGYS
ncbi:MAG: transposase [Methanomethylovorans sp.]|nr:transposase [Methanomethylovorans sp.]